MKKEYISPQLDCVKFSFEQNLLASGPETDDPMIYNGEAGEGWEDFDG